MPKSSKKTGSGKGHQATQRSSHSDFTLADHADAVSPVAGRMKKGVANDMNLKVREMSGKSSEKAASELAWDEKDLSDFDSDDACDIVSEETENSDSVVRQSPKKKMARKQSSGGNVYPLDIWFLIGDFVQPECVGLFALICRSSHIVVHSARFWQNLYFKYYQYQYRGDRELMEGLQPKYMYKIHGLQTRVVRALFYLYPLFVERVTRRIPFENSPDMLEGALCVLMWHKKVKNNWYFYFKFRTQNTGTSVAPSGSHGRFSQFAADITHNSENGCRVLQVLTSNFISLPVIMGYSLHKTFLFVGHGMRSHKLKMVFTQQRLRDDKVALATGIALVMDPVSNLRILPWWDPKYPCPVT